MSLLSCSLNPTHGFHSTLSTRIALNSPASDCSAFVLFALPPSIIIDRYELLDRRLTFELWGESNLELPVFAADQSDTVLLLNVTPTVPHSSDAIVDTDIPVHARYGTPESGRSKYYRIEVPPPTCFWACPHPVDMSSPSSQPPVANSAMLQPSTHFFVSPNAASTQSPSLEVPLGSLDDLPRVQAATTLVILFAFLWLVYRSCILADALQPRHLKEK
ncbi:PIG-X [Phlebopus sp. FC_14]|nr:PIG-X [Phlebopus sp. FC_14]